VSIGESNRLPKSGKNRKPSLNWHSLYEKKKKKNVYVRPSREGSVRTKLFIQEGKAEGNFVKTPLCS